VVDHGAGSVARSSVASIWIRPRVERCLEHGSITMHIVVNRNPAIRRRSTVQGGIIHTAGLARLECLGVVKGRTLMVV